MVGRVDNPSDESGLIRAAMRGDLQAFNTLVLRYQDAAYTLAYRLMGDRAIAADMAQESMITAYQRLKTFRGERFRPWLMRIVTNRCYDEMRRKKRRPTLSITPDAEDEDLPLPDDAPAPEAAAEQRELQRAIQQCIDNLNPEQRTALVLCDVDGMAYQDIADSLGTQIGTIKSRLSRARTSVRDCLKGVRELLPTAYRLIIEDDDDRAS